MKEFRYLSHSTYYPITNQSFYLTSVPHLRICSLINDFHNLPKCRVPNNRKTMLENDRNTHVLQEVCLNKPVQSLMNIPSLPAANICDQMISMCPPICK